MSRYMIFGGDLYYPQGGAKDFLQSMDDRNLAVSFAEGFVAGNSLRWVHVLDTLKPDIIFAAQSPVS